MQAGNALRLVPERVKGTSVHQTMESLVAHTLRSKDLDSAAWLSTNATQARLTVIYDYDRAQYPDDTADATRARWREHQALYDFPVSDAWKFWQGISGKGMGQSELAALLESRITELKGPDAAGPRVFEIARALAAGDDDENPVEVEARARGLIATPAQLLRFSRTIANLDEKFAFTSSIVAENARLLSLLPYERCEGGFCTRWLDSAMSLRTSC